MASLLRDCEEFAVPYLDDVAIFSNTWEDHVKHLEEIFVKMKTAKLHLKPSKCQFAREHVKYLGHIVGQSQRKPGELKIQAVKEFPRPQNKTQIRSFLGLAGYYRRYIPDFSVIAAPLTDLLKGKDVKSSVNWTSTCEDAFEELKKRLSERPVLYSPDFTASFIIQSDASNFGIGVVLSQINQDSEEHPIMPLRLPFGLKNAPYDFSRLMASFLRDCEEFAVPYLDDVAIFSNTWEDHVKHLEEIFVKMKTAKLHLKPSKCQFAREHVKYLGHIVGQGQRKPGELKIQAVKEFPRPQNKTQIRSFLGLAGYYRRYIPDFSRASALGLLLLDHQQAFFQTGTRLLNHPT
ncbi:hypothetical protein JTE90_029686 [Oedothorax gibbosus]|uniref:RNA-directed DNA polymerase n=1 Tax=Oedothorax gibbosus TaxID=931172 RepID=A0AAV6U0J9_9ARAC|nr:hypothetical protein JTE90_029686 [Oedothorax gibbosus]